MVNGYTWAFTIAGGGATIEYGNGQGQRAVEPEPVGALEIPSELGGWPVTAIGCYAFYYCDQIRSVFPVLNFALFPSNFTVTSPSFSTSPFSTDAAFFEIIIESGVLLDESSSVKQLSWLALVDTMFVPCGVMSMRIPVSAGLFVSVDVGAD